jgi:ATP-dependent Lhr-like helicase
VEQALAEMEGLGMVTSDGFAGLRTLITPSNKRKPLIAGAVRRTRTVPFGLESAGRWSRLETYGADESENGGDRVLTHAWALLHRYGVVFSRLLARESSAPAWRDLLMAYRRLEARGEIRGGRFVAGMSGEQFALPGAVVRVRAIRRTERDGALVGISAADPLNLTGIVTPGERVPALAGNRILYEDGVPIMALVAGQVKPLGAFDTDRTAALTQSLIRRPLAPALRARLAMSGTPAGSVSLTERGRRRRRARSSVDNPGEEIR